MRYTIAYLRDYLSARGITLTQQRSKEFRHYVTNGSQARLFRNKAELVEWCQAGNVW